MISTAKAIKKTREAQGMTQKELAERCGYTVTDIKADEINGMKKRHEKIDLMATEYDNICEKYDKLYGKEQM